MFDDRKARMKTIFTQLVPNGVRHRIPEVESLRHTQFAARSDTTSLLFGNFPSPIHPLNLLLSNGLHTGVTEKHIVQLPDGAIGKPRCVNN